MQRRGDYHGDNRSHYRRFSGLLISCHVGHNARVAMIIGQIVVKHSQKIVSDVWGRQNTKIWVFNNIDNFHMLMQENIEN